MLGIALDGPSLQHMALSTESPIANNGMKEKQQNCRKVYATTLASP
jgi:hypothetical protein